MAARRKMSFVVGLVVLATVVVSACAVSTTNNSTDLLIRLPSLSSSELEQQSTCWQLPGIVESSVRAAGNQAAGLLRIFFHDCFPQGCDASILLFADRPNGGERGFPQNGGLQDRALRLIEEIRGKAHQHAVCRDTVSCADILALATAEAVFHAGGPNFDVPLGRLDSKAPAQEGEIKRLPGPSESFRQLSQRFRDKKQGLDDTDLIALSGAHTVGTARCGIFRDRINRANPSDGFAQELRRFCSSDENRRQLDGTPFRFDNRYFQDLKDSKGVLLSDMALVSSDANHMRWLVDGFARDEGWFRRQFAVSMVKLSKLSWRTRADGEIRRNSCFRTNSGRFQLNADDDLAADA